MDAAEFRAALIGNAEKHRPKSVSIRELHEGHGPVAETGSWVTVHYKVTLLGDDSVLEETRTSGYGDRDYGQPLTFELGDLGDVAVLRALHAAVLDMRVGGRRRVRTALGEPDFGYRHPPDAVSRDFEGRRIPRSFQVDWLIDVEIALLAVSDQPPPSAVARVLSANLPSAAVEQLRGFGLLR